VNRTAFSLLAVACLLVVLSGCSSSVNRTPSSTRANEPVVTSIPTISAAAQVNRPIDAYLPSAQDVGALFRYELALLDRCISAHATQGTTRVMGDPTAYISGLLRDRVLRNSVYGLFDPGAARTTGYHTPAAARLSIVDPQGEKPDVGRECRTQVAKTFAGRDAMTYADVRVLPDRGPPDESGDSRYRAAVSRWSACMKDKGYAFADPLQPLQQFTHAAQADQQEIDTATVDVGCKVSTNLVGVAVAVQSALDQRYIDAHVTQLAEFTSSVQGLLRAAGRTG